MKVLHPDLWATLAAAILAGGSASVCAQGRTDSLRFVLLTPFVDYSFFEPIKKGMNDAARSLGVQAVFSGTPDGNMAKLAAQVRAAVNSGYDGIALNIVDPTALDAAVAEAVQKRIPVIAFNVDDDRTPNARLAAVGQNMPEAGRAFGKAVARFLAPGSHVLLTMHDPNISALEERAAGAREILKSRGLTWTTVITGTDPRAAVEKIHAALAGDASIKAVLSTGSADTEAAGRAIEKFFPSQGFFCAGFDLSPEILRLVKNNVIHLTVDQQPYAQGYYAVVELALYKRYGIKPVNIDTGATLITADQVDRVIGLSRQHYR